MGTIWIKEMTGGLDTRRLPETTPGGVLVKAQDGHITRGGEFETRAAFVPTYDLPEGTTGIASDKTGLVVFGIGETPSNIPFGVRYQQLANPNNAALEIDRILSHDLYAGKLYVSVLYENGSVVHFYDGVAVDDWFDGRARATLTIVNGANDVAVAATASFAVTGGTSAGLGEITNVMVNGIAITTNPVLHTDSNTSTAAAVAAEINSTTSSPDYSATSDGNVVTISAPAGSDANGRILSVTVNGDATVGSLSNFSGGDDAATSQISDLTVDGVSIISAPVEWAGSTTATAAALAAEINGTTSSPQYEATATTDEVNIIANDAGTDANGREIEVTTLYEMQVSNETGLTLTGGEDRNGTTATATVTLALDGEDASAQGSFRISAVKNPGQNDSRIKSVTVSGVSLMTSQTSEYGSTSTLAAAVVTKINDNTGVTGFSADRDGSTVYLYAPAGTTYNGVSAAVSTEDCTVSDITAFSGGASFSASLDTLEVEGTALIDEVVAAVDDNEETFAEAVATAINDETGTHGYTAESSGAQVQITAPAEGPEYNGYAITATVSGGATATATAFSGGEDEAFTPGPFVKTVRTKMYAVSDSLLHFSGIQAPTEWTTDATGAGFINLATEDADAENLTAIARYSDGIAVFAETVTMIWYIDPDPDLNTLSQVLASTGTKYAGSVTQFGDSDVFYLDSSGLRSLRARDSSNAAATTDIGVPVDSVITAKLDELEGEEFRAIGLINPIDKRFWLIMKDEIFVFSFYENAKVSAWSTYKTSTKDGDTETAFDVDAAVIHSGRPYLRSGNTIYVYGGASGALQYDDTEAEVWLPYLDANTPTAKKQWQGVDIALTGTWEISAATEPSDTTAEEIIARAFKTSYNMGRIPMSHASSHISLRFRSTGGYAVLSAAVIHYEGGDED